MIIQGFLTDIARSIGFLSRLPVADRFFVGHDGSMGQMVRAFPVAGALISLPAAAVLAVVLALSQQPMLAAVLALAMQALVTGALHEDGLGDCADGLGGGRDREKALAIMRDSRIGSYGAVALILSFLIRTLALSGVGTLMSPTHTALAYCGIAALSRAALVWHWSQLPPARRDGVAASSGAPESDAVTFALVVAAAAVGLLILPFAGLTVSALVLALPALAAWAFTGHVEKKLGGHTGDTIGATQQIAEMSALVALAVFL